MSVPYGWQGAKADFRTWCVEAGAQTLRAKLRVAANSPALWGLVFYRFGRWLYVERRGNRWLRLAAKVLHLVLRRPMTWITRVMLPPQCAVGAGVWIGSHDAIWAN